MDTLPLVGVAWNDSPGVWAMEVFELTRDMEVVPLRGGVVGASERDDAVFFMPTESDRPSSPLGRLRGWLTTSSSSERSRAGGRARRRRTAERKFLGIRILTISRLFLSGTSSSLWSPVAFRYRGGDLRSSLYRSSDSDESDFFLPSAASTMGGSVGESRGGSLGFGLFTSGCLSLFRGGDRTGLWSRRFCSFLAVDSSSKLNRSGDSKGGTDDFSCTLDLVGVPRLLPV